MKKVVTFGEIMLRLTPPGADRLVQADCFDAHFGGSEFNVAAGAVGLGLEARFVTRLPDNPLGYRAIRAIRSTGVEPCVGAVVPKGRLGIYFLEAGWSPRPNRVIYDREGSSLALANADDFNWDEYLDSASWFHVSGITPALSESLLRATVDAVEIARERDVPVSFDINYRAKLWTTDEARRALQPLLEQCRAITSTEEDLDRVFGIVGDSPKEIAERARDLFDVDLIGITLRELITVRRNRWGGCGIGPDGYVESPMYEIDIVDRVGAGDSFTAGLIAGMLGGDPEYAVNLAAAFSAIKQTIPGDVCLASRAEAEALMKSGRAGRIER